MPIRAIDDRQRLHSGTAGVSKRSLKRSRVVAESCKHAARPWRVAYQSETRNSQHGKWYIVRQIIVYKCIIFQISHQNNRNTRKVTHTSSTSQHEVYCCPYPRVHFSVILVCPTIWEGLLGSSLSRTQAQMRLCLFYRSSQTAHKAHVQSQSL